MDDTGFVAFVQREGQRLARAAYLLCGDAHEAEELTQAALARAYEKWPRVSGADNPGAYVQRILVNEARQRWRRQQRAPHLEPADASDPTGDWATRHDLVRALQALPDRQREVVVLRHFLDRSEAETATAMGCRPGTVKSQLSKALTALRAALTEEVSP